MATVAESLFGVTPESLQRQRQQQLRQEAMDYASIADPFQQANYAIYQGVGNLGRGIGGLLGAEDPELMRVRQRQELLQGVDIADPVALREAASRLLQSGDSPAAAELARRALDIETKQAGIAKDVAAAQASTATAAAGRLTPEQRNAAGIADTKAERGTPEWTSTYNAELVRLTTKPEARINYGEEANRVAVATFGKPFAELTQEQARQVDQTLEKRGITKAQAGKTTVDLSGLKDAGDITSFRKDVQAITKPYQDQIDAADDAISLATMAINNKNFAAVSSLSRSLAKASGETQLSGRDVEAFGIDPSLVGRVADTASRLAQSRPTVDTLTKLRQLAEAIKKKAEGRLSVEEEQLQATARASKRFTDEQINTVFRRRPASGGGGNTRTTKSGVTYTVEKD